MKTSRSTAAARTCTLLLILLVAGALALAACSNGNVTTAKDTSASPWNTVAVSSDEGAASTQSTPGVGTIAFTRAATPNGHTEIYLVRTDGSGLKRLTHSATNAYGPAWSPDGGKIAYLAGGERGGKIRGSGVVWVVNADGSRPHRPDPRGYGGTGWVTGVAWSPDGRQLALTMGHLGYGGYGEHGDLAVMNTDGSDFRILNSLHQESAPYDHPVWSPTGRIFFSRTGDNRRRAISSVNPDGSDLTDVTAFPADYGYSFSVSQDGRWLALFDSKEGQATYRAANGHGREDMFLEAKRLATLTGENRLKFRWIIGASWIIGGSSWSPDGTRIAFVGRARAGMLGSASALYIVGIDGSGIRMVPNTGPFYGVEDPAWQPQ